MLAYLDTNTILVVIASVIALCLGFNSGFRP